MSRPLLAPFSTSVVVLALAALGAAPASAQFPDQAPARPRGPQPLTTTQYGIGYVANAPDATVGGGAYVLSPRWGGIGVYLDAKFDISNPTDERGYDPSVTSQQVADMVGGQFRGTEASWRSMNVALMRPLTPSLIAYAGGGMARMTVFDLYNVDPEEPVGLGGLVWAENPDATETRVNLMVGFLMRLTSRVSAHFGYETQPAGATVGASLRIPRW